MPAAEAADAVASAQARANALQQQADRLSDQLHRITSLLSARTTNALALTVAHAATADHLARHCVGSMHALRESSDAFLEEMRQLRASLDVITSIARTTQQVRLEVLRLETFVNNLGPAVAP